MSDDRGVAAVLHSLGSVARERARYDAARALHTESRTLWQRLSDAEGMARSANYLSLLAWLQQDLATAVAFAEEALEGYRIVGDGEGVAWSLINLAASALYDGHRTQAAGLLRESLSSSRGVGYREGVAWSLNLLGVLSLEQGDHARAYGLLQESLREHWSLGDRWRTASVLETIAAVDALTGQHERAARVLGAAAALRSVIGAPIPPVERDLMHRATTSLDAALGPDAWHGIERLGRLADVDTVVGEVLASSPARHAERADPQPAHVEQRVHLAVTTLGSCRVHLDDVPIASAEFGYAKPRELLCFLLDRRDATKDQIGAALWPWAAPGGLRSSFHTCLHHVRSALGADRVIFADGRYAFNRALPYEYDVESFEMLLGRARTGSNPADDLQRAIALYHGDYLADLPGEMWIDERRRQLRRSFERALSDLGQLLARAARHAEAIDVLHRAVEHDPLMEAAHRELMRCYAASGERGAALRQYGTLTALLREELGAAPTPETAALNARIRRGDPL
jgi:DNA-binding SARP family transcriptional activator